MSAQNLPFVSVILPIRNEVDYIEPCLARLLGQDYPADLFEILVVDGCSEDGTRELVRGVQERAGAERVRLLDNPRRIVPSALNIAVNSARGAVIVRMDGHTVPASDYVSSCVRALHESGADNVGGPMVPVGDTTFGRAVAVAQQHPLGVGDAKFHFDGPAAFVDTVYMGAFRREAFGRAGLFDESMVRNQDYEMNVRIRKAGGKIYLDPRVRSVYTPRGSLRGLWRQYFQYGWWRVETIRRHPESVRWRQLVPPAFVLALVLLVLAAPFLAPARLLLIAVLAPYVAAIVTAAIMQRRKLPWRALPLLPAAFATLHISWGLGFLLNVLSSSRFPYRAGPAEVPLLPSQPVKNRARPIESSAATGAHSFPERVS